MKTSLFDLDGTLLALDSQDFMHTYFGELTHALHGLLSAEGPARNILTTATRMHATTNPDSSNPVKFRRELASLYQDVDWQTVRGRIMNFYRMTFDNAHVP